MKKYFVKMDEATVQLLPPNVKISVLNKKGDVITSTVTTDKGFKFTLLPSDQSKLALTKEDDVKLQMSMSGKLLSGIGANKPLNNVKVDLVNEKGEVVQTVYTDADGNFKFSQLPADRNFMVRVDEGDPKLAKLPKILLADDKGKVVGEMEKGKSNAFRYEYLAADKASYSLMSVDDSQLKFSMKGKISNGDGTGKAIANVKVNLLNEKGEIVQTGYTDADGNFVFKKLPADQNYYVAVDEKDAKLSNIKHLLLSDGSGNGVKDIRVDSKGKFKFQLLASDLKSQSLMEVEDVKLRTDLFGKLMTKDGTDKTLANKKVTLVNEKGEVLDSATTDANGQFVFKNLPADQKYLVKMDDSDASLAGNMKLLLTDDKGNNAHEFTASTEGVFQYELLSADRKIFTPTNENEGNMKLVLKGRFLVGDSVKTEPLVHSKVNLFDEKDKLIKTTTTDNFGRFMFTDLSPDQKFIIKMDEADAKLKAAKRLILADEAGVTVHELGKKNKFKFVLLPSDMKALSTEEADDSENNLKLLGKKLFVGVAPKTQEKKFDLPAGTGQFATIYYETGKSDVPKDAIPELDQIAEYLKNTKGAVLEIRGNTDSRAGERYNLFLSANRVQKIKNYLAIEKGVDVRYLNGIALGESEPAVECGGEIVCTEEQYAQNRRVEFKVTFYHYKKTK